MPRVKKYPQWVHDLCPPGHTAKLKDGKYYLYKTKCKYVPGKNPQPVNTYVGRITKDGIVYSTRRRVDMKERPVWYEYGFSYTLYQLAFPILNQKFNDHEKTYEIILRIIKRYSQKSYLLKDIQIEDNNHLNVCISNQIKKIEETIGHSMEDLLILKDILVIEIDHQKIITSITEENRKLLEELEVTIDD